METNLGRTETALLTNKSGGDLTAGAVVIVDTSNASSFDTTTTQAYNDGRAGVLLHDTANNAAGLVAFVGYVPRINLDASASIGDLVYCSSSAGEGTPHASPLVNGDFAQVLETGTTPAALLFGVPLKMQSTTSIMVQEVYTQSGAGATGTTTIPHDDTIPQSSEGTELTALNTAITPTSASNILRIQATIHMAVSTASVLGIVALFQDSGADALAVSSMHAIGAGAGHIMLHIDYSMVAGTTSATTFKIRFGPAQSATVTINGHGGSREFGGVQYSTLKITEYVP